MSTILAILGAVAQLKNLFGSSNDSTTMHYFSSYPIIEQKYSSGVDNWLGVPFKK